MDNNLGKYAATGATTGLGLGGPAGAAIGAGAGLALGGVEYLWNRSQAKKDEANRPAYDIPQEVNQGLALANQRALQGLPEAQKQQYRTDLERGAAYQLGQSSSRKGGLSGLAALNENLNRGYGNLFSQDAAARMANQKDLYGQLGNVADYKQQKFQLSQMNPYYENMARDQANRGALLQNVSKGAQPGMYGLGSASQGKSMQMGQQPVVNNNLSPDQIGQEMSADQFNKPSTQYAPTTPSYGTMGEELGWGSYNIK